MPPSSRISLWTTWNTAIGGAAMPSNTPIGRSSGSWPRNDTSRRWRPSSAIRRTGYGRSSAATTPGDPPGSWAEDEHRLGLLPVLRRVRAPRGQRPTAWGNRRYQWLYVYAFVRSTTVSTAAMSAALAVFAWDEGIDAAHRAVLVLDGAGWHTSGTLAVPEGIDLVYLPPASPNSIRSSGSGPSSINRWPIGPLPIWMR